MNKLNNVTEIISYSNFNYVHQVYFINIQKLNNK